MSPNAFQITNVFNLSFYIIFSFIAFRSFYLYSRVQGARLFILGLSMGIIALTEGADFVSGSVTAVILHTEWFLYIGQAAGYLFIFLSIVINTEQRLCVLMRWQVVISLFLIALPLLSPILPAVPDLPTKMLLSGPRCLICFAIFLYYAALATSRGTRFSAFMCGGFMFLSFGYLLILLKYFHPDPTLLDHTADTIRISGLALLFGGFTLGK